MAYILYTVEGAKLEKSIKDAVKACKERLDVRHNLLLEMLPEFAQAFQNCMSFLLEADAAFNCDTVEKSLSSNIMKSSSKYERN